jgi:hypothetical protein
MTNHQGSDSESAGEECARRVGVLLSPRACRPGQPPGPIAGASGPLARGPGGPYAAGACAASPSPLASLLSLAAVGLPEPQGVLSTLRIH